MKIAVDVNKLEISSQGAIAAGCYVFQAHRFAHDEVSHLLRLLNWADLPYGSRVVDLGSGTGAMAYAWSHARPDLNLCLVNISAFQLAAIPQFCEQICCDMRNVPAPDESFDATTCCFTIGHVDAYDAFAEMSRLVRPGGVVFVYDMIRYSGTNDKLNEVAYSVDSRADMENAAEKAGLVLDYFMEPQEIGSFGKTFLGDAYDGYFEGVKPAIWRWIKPHNKEITGLKTQ